MLITAILLSRSCPIVDLKNVLMRRSESLSIDLGSGWIFATDSYVNEIVRCSLSGLHPTSGSSCV